MKLLFVDDDPDLVMIMEYRLQKAGIDMVVASSGEEALRQLAHSFDAVILDIQIPDINGLEVAQAVPLHTPIIFVTGKVDYDQKLLPKRDNVKLMIKPCEFTQLLHLLEHLVAAS